MNIKDVMEAAIEAIRAVHEVNLAIEVIQLRSDVWDELVEYHKERGMPEPPGNRWEFCGIRAERKELMQNAFRIVTFGTELGGVVQHEIVTGTETTVTYSIVTPIENPFGRDIFNWGAAE
ncbi:hypothetical protein 049ML003_71 [Bacillus phage 049ML003]|nr:hypothetical protein 049ML003_71 [Bacillus phage 049ML003]